MEFYPAMRIMKTVADPELAEELNNKNYTSPRMDDAFGQQTLQLASSIDDMIISVNNNTALTRKSKGHIKEAVLLICVDEEKHKKLEAQSKIPLCTDALAGCEVPLHPDILHLLWSYIHEIMKDEGFVVGSRFGFIGYTSSSNMHDYPYNTVVYDAEGTETEYTGMVHNKRSKEITINRDIRESLEKLIFKNKSI